MADFLQAYSIQHWLESCPQGYLAGTSYGHAPDARESEVFSANEILRDDAIRMTVQLVAGERCALAASSGLVNAAPDDASKLFLATQTLDEARHVEIFTQRLRDLGVAEGDLDQVIRDRVEPSLVKFAEALLEKVDKKDFVAGVVGQNLILEGMAFTVFELMHAMHADANPKFAQTLSGTIADERRHVGFGENRIASLIREHGDRKAEVQRLQREMSGHMLATFASAFSKSRPAFAEGRRVFTDREPVDFHGTNLAAAELSEIEGALAATVLNEFQSRLGRVGIEFQAPS
ncbi:MAG: long-chain fatty aldehyde decarbonylase [Polyangiaceae bacterium]|nr:long-chain fatty aldehyde decarbonylase [Polyangiaceae bacterium]